MAEKNPILNYARWRDAHEDKIKEEKLIVYKRENTQGFRVLQITPVKSTCTWISNFKDFII